MQSTNPSALDTYFMQLALDQARMAMTHSEVPVGAVVVHQGKVIGAGYNRCIAHHDPTAHAEMVAIRHACESVSNYRLIEATLYVTLEPCVMCLGAIFNARLSRVVYGANDFKAGACGSVVDLPGKNQLNHHTGIESGVLEPDCKRLLQEFFKARRPDASERLQRVQSLIHIPNLDKNLVRLLEQTGYDSPTSLANFDARVYVQTHQASYTFTSQQLSMLLALEAFVRGEPVSSWTAFEEQANAIMTLKHSPQ